MREFSAFYRDFQVTSGQMTALPGPFPSPEVTWPHFLSRDCLLLELQPCRNWNVQYTPVFGLLQSLPGDFWLNEATSGHLRHVTSFPVTWLPPPASYSLVGSEMYSNASFLPTTATFRWPVKWRHFRVTSGRQATWRHFLSRDCLLLRATAL